MFRHRINSSITEEPTHSSFQSGKASIIGMRPSEPSRDSCTSSTSSTSSSIDSTYYYDQPQQQEYQYQYGDNLNRPSPPLTPRNDEPLTIESMSAVIAAAVQMSATTGTKSSLSMGHASIKPQEKQTQGGDDKVKRRFSLFSWKKQQQQEPPALVESTSTTTITSSPRSSSTVDDGLDELAYRGIQIKEIKTTLKPMVIPSNVANPMPTVKLERPGFARINY
ncbi:hypothetical protein BC941DRAFT_440303 [Chlamydoabsidia padenii]|nr:hypothetical protein BC941DRAFT_440303 [Chlamydoabsidia padenii]